MTPDFVIATAGLIAGSMPTIGIGHRARSASIAMPVAVLHATTTDLAPSLLKKSTMLVARRSMKSAGLSPYGACPESAT